MLDHYLNTDHYLKTDHYPLNTSFIKPKSPKSDLSDVLSGIQGELFMVAVLFGDLEGPLTELFFIIIYLIFLMMF